MDEPTSMLTGKETKILFDLIATLSSQGIAVVYISHRLKEIIDVCHKVTVLKDGLLVAMKDVADVTAQDLAALMVGREVQTTKASDFSGDPEAVMLEVRGVTDSLLKDVSFKVRKGEILGFSGLVGAGSTELMEVIFGMRRPKSGQRAHRGKARHHPQRHGRHPGRPRVRDRGPQGHGARRLPRHHGQRELRELAEDARASSRAGGRPWATQADDRPARPSAAAAPRSS